MNESHFLELWEISDRVSAFAHLEAWRQWVLSRDIGTEHEETGEYDYSA